MPYRNIQRDWVYSLSKKSYGQFKCFWLSYLGMFWSLFMSKLEKNGSTTGIFVLNEISIFLLYKYIYIYRCIYVNMEKFWPLVHLRRVIWLQMAYPGLDLIVNYFSPKNLFELLFKCTWVRCARSVEESKELKKKGCIYNSTA